MTRDYRKLKTFQYADELVIEVYRVTTSFPKHERYGIISQLRRAALSIPTNIVEGSHRRTEREFLQFLNIAMGSAAETGYLLDIAHRLGYIEDEKYQSAIELHDKCIRHLHSLIRHFETLTTKKRK